MAHQLEISNSSLGKIQRYLTLWVRSNDVKVITSRISYSGEFVQCIWHATRNLWFQGKICGGVCHPRFHLAYHWT